MTASQSRKLILRRGTAAILVIVAAGVFVYFQDNFLLRTIVILVVMFATLIVNSRQKSLVVSARSIEKQQALALKPWHWFVGIALAVAVAASLIWLYRDAKTGCKDVASVYVFAVLALICGAWWAGLYARWIEMRS